MSNPVPDVWFGCWRLQTPFERPTGPLMDYLGSQNLCRASIVWPRGRGIDLFGRPWVEELGRRALLEHYSIPSACVRALLPADCPIHHTHPYLCTRFRMHFPCDAPAPLDRLATTPSLIHAHGRRWARRDGGLDGWRRGRLGRLEGGVVDSRVCGRLAALIIHRSTDRSIEPRSRLARGPTPTLLAAGRA